MTLSITQFSKFIKMLIECVKCTKNIAHCCILKNVFYDFIYCSVEVFTDEIVVVHVCL